MRTLLIAMFAAVALHCSCASVAPSPAARLRPSAAAIPATPLPTPAAAVPLYTDPVLRAELLSIRAADQEVRKRWIADRNNAELAREIGELNVKQVARIQEVLRTHGWPTKAMVGPEGSGAVWIVLQHASADVLHGSIPLMKEAAARGDIETAIVATSVDRDLIQQGKRQLYGTQFDTDVAAKKCEPMPIEDAAHVDERRKAAGLGSLVDYTKLLCSIYMRPQQSH